MEKYDDSKWFKVVSRPLTGLTLDIISQGMSKEIPKLVGVNFDIVSRVEDKKKLCSILQNLESKRNLKEAFLANKNPLEFMKEHLLEGKKRLKKILNTTEVISKSNMSVSSSKLLKYWDLFKKDFYSFSPFMHTVFAPEQILTEGLKNKINIYLKDASQIKQDKIFRVLTTVQENSDFFQEQKDLLEIAILKRSGVNIDKQIKQHSANFGYMGLTTHLLSEPYDDDYFLKTIENIKNPAEELNNLTANQEEKKAKYIESISSLPKDIIEISELLQDYMIFRMNRITVLTLGQYRIRSLLRAIANKFNIKFEDIVWYNVLEIDNLFKNKTEIDIIKRKQYFTNILIGGIVSYSELPFEEEKTYFEEIKGTVANSGTYKGRVRIILSTEMAKELQNGEILVTTMTTPNLIGVIKRSGAIITDEGGILCHAAIVSRELGIPCIIGTKIATQILKDGDLVEVDANKGMIKILEKT
ncbi:MAG: PEP-utilizing enzyme [Candidatus Paceibacterota bacterium]